MIVSLADQKKEHRAVDHRHLKIEDEQVVGFLESKLESVFRAGRSIDLAFQKGGQCFARHSHETHIVVDYQNAVRRVLGHEWTLAQKAAAFQAFPVENILDELARALRMRLAIIADERSRRNPAQHTERLKEISQRIELLEKALPPATNAQLRHFLQRRSYTKALEFLTASGD